MALDLPSANGPASTVASTPLLSPSASRSGAPPTKPPVMVTTPARVPSTIVSPAAATSRIASRSSRTSTATAGSGSRRSSVRTVPSVRPANSFSWPYDSAVGVSATRHADRVASKRPAVTETVRSDGPDSSSSATTTRSAAPQTCTVRRPPMRTRSVTAPSTASIATNHSPERPIRWRRALLKPRSARSAGTRRLCSTRPVARSRYTREPDGR